MNQDKPIFVPHEDSTNNSSDQNNTPAADPNDNQSNSTFDPPLSPSNPIEKPTTSPSSNPQINDLTAAPKFEAKSIPETPAPTQVPPKPEVTLTQPVDTSKPAPTAPVFNKEPDLASTMFPPKKTSGTGVAVATTAILAVAFVAIGFAGGFFGYKYSPKLASLIKTSADSSNATTTTDNTQPQSTSATPGDVSVWPIYDNTTYLYSVKYPDNWYSQNTDDSTAATATFTNFAPQSKTNTEEKIEVSAQSANSQDLKTWIEAQNTISQNTATLTKLTISGQDAYQQETAGENKTLTTFIKQGENIISIIYSADAGVYNDGKAVYNTVIASFKLS
ncbi:TPA: hypothetical protein DD449_00310 [Candidatus Berkelbacteria bacterium]|uniref:Uncharacterized protein n=1 Tax=Berkelbacteria bacterium GW2011_GWE1_39_12 TaxID=1618337 RepID=A0A0G4B4D1_9BACT|nr:MAG: hypothetical protein UT28_C0001G1027 [Berkelbacteria bacterium GW2011_GWE1_39_12]HBO60116.1 hypothetical protein [Candidatus Berkelbacteria bacterium]